MSGRAWCAAASGAALAMVLLAAPMPAAADGGVSVWVGGGCCYPHRHLYPGWREPVYVMPPPPVVYGYGPPVVYAPPVAYVSPGAVQAVPASPDYVDGAGRLCREYQTTVTVGGTRQPSYGTACRMPDGSWRIMN